MTVQWQKRNDYPFLDGWCRFNSDILDDPRLEARLETRFGVIRTDIVGVYIIWAGSDNRTILKVGSGIIKDRFRKHLNDPEVLQYYSQGLYATWTTLPISFKPSGELNDRERGIERFLGLILNPVLGERFPANVDPIWVNLPAWDPPVNPFLRAISQSRHTQPNGSLEQLRKKQRNPFFKRSVIDEKRVLL